MKEKYQIDITEVKKWLRNINPFIRTSNYDYSKFSNDYTSKHLKDVFNSYTDTHILDGEALQNIFFPTQFKDTFKIFISHSGGDKEIVKEFANKIGNIYDKPCFVDWMVWDNIGTLQGILDNKFSALSRDKDGKILSYNYKAMKHTSAHTHAMLSMAQIGRAHV